MYQFGPHKTVQEAAGAYKPNAVYAEYPRYGLLTE
jgi:hypothetical protein